VHTLFTLAYGLIDGENFILGRILELNQKWTSLGCERRTHTLHESACTCPLTNHLYCREVMHRKALLEKLQMR